MPRKPRVEKQTITVVVGGTPVSVVLHPPTGARSSWYAYWNGLVSSRSTGQRNLEDAIVAAENMVRAGGRRATLDDAVLTDEEFEGVQRTHYAKKTDPAAKRRADKTLDECLDAIDAFKDIMRLPRIASATPDDCASFQREALQRACRWRDGNGPESVDGPTTSKKRRLSKTQKRRLLAGQEEPTERLIRPNTVLKWSRMLQAAFNRVNRSAGKKCVRGVVPVAKLLRENPWAQFTWIEGTEKEIQHFDTGELLGFLSYLEERWQGVPVALLATKVLLWSCCRKTEVAGLKWEGGRVFTNERQVVLASECSLTADHCVAVQGKPAVVAEVHFEVVGKWGVERWFRIPQPLFRELLANRTDSPFVFAAYSEQIATVHAENVGCLKKIRPDFDLKNFGRWLYERMKDWAVTQPRGDAYLHIFRKTGLQFTHDGEEEEVSKRVADDAGVSEAVLLGSYVKPKLWRKSNRTFRRLLASLPPAVASRYGHIEDERTRLERQLGAATEGGNWPLVAELAARLGQMDREGRPQAG
jgi:hypothetical protein